MAIGLARLLGFNLQKNFAFPFFASNISLFWRRWHISLTSWMTDYIHLPLSFALRNLGTLGAILAVIGNFVIVGLWHGANWTFVLFGFLHGCFFIPFLLKRKVKVKTLDNSQLSKNLGALFTFGLVMMTMVLLRASNLTQALSYYSNMMSKSLLMKPELGIYGVGLVLLFIVIMFIIEWFNRKEEHGLVLRQVKSKPVRWFVYLLLVVAIGLFGGFAHEKFIYFNF
jgi:D-alanyl-lipoteichoic acid acyltransferase DltB (MBOAT superfamily)